MIGGPVTYLDADETGLKVVPCANDVRVTARGPFTHLCPYEDETDDCTIVITWSPDGTEQAATIELHSLRAYLDSFDESKVSHEDVVQIIRHELRDIPGICDVTVELLAATAGFTVTVAAPWVDVD